MVSIAQTAVKPQGGEGAPSNLSEADSYRLVVRFGKDLLSDGFTALPNLLLDLYAELGITHCELVLLLHLLQYKWSKHDPYPSLGTIATKMGLSLRAVQNHVHSLRHKAYQCPHTDEEECSCPKYLEVTPRYRAGIGQTSSSYNLSGLFAAIITLAREKGLLKAEDNAKNCTPPVKKVAPGGCRNLHTNQTNRRTPIPNQTNLFRTHSEERMRDRFHVVMKSWLHEIPKERRVSLLLSTHRIANRAHHVLHTHHHPTTREHRIAKPSV